MHKAGGSKTNKNGKEFENKTCVIPTLIKLGFNPEVFQKKYFCYHKPDNLTVMVNQSSFKAYIYREYGIKVFRHPDESYITKRTSGKTIIKILEKKAQFTDGSVETKLWSALALKREYQIIFGNSFEIHYAFCVNDYFRTKFEDEKNVKYNVLRQILTENNIVVFYGETENYFDDLLHWINYVPSEQSTLHLFSTQDSSN
jgi:hypothetical protein